MNKTVIPIPRISECQGVWRSTLEEGCYDLWSGEANVLLNNEIFWPKPVDLSFPLWPYYFIENSRCDKQWYRHVNYMSLSLTLVLSGKIKYSEDNFTQIVGPGEVFIQLPGTSDRMINADDLPTHKLCIIFDSNAIMTVAPMFGIKNNVKLSLTSPSTVEHKMRQIGKLLEKQKAGSECKVSEKSYALLLEILKQQEQPRPVEIKNLLEIIDKVGYSSCTCKQLVELSSLSESTVLRLFKKYFNCTPSNYIFNKRLEQSLTLLKANYSVKETAFCCGFADSAHFSRVFKKHFKVSPTESFKLFPTLSPSKDKTK